ncbi:TPA: AEC family transporter [Campylobacter fetus subsp. venerealis]|nr:AEC family transporter [Campylobacter fetus subsp. venerealis]
MEYIFNALLPICLIISTGYFFKSIKFPSTEFWPKMDKFTYYVLMPCLLIYELGSVDLDIKSTINIVFSSLSSLGIMLVILVLLNLIIRFKNAEFTSVVQGGIRFNTYVFLALTSAIYGKDGLVVAAIIIAFAIPFVNILCISIFAIYVKNGKFSMQNFIKTIVKNPLIVACIVGYILNLANAYIPTFIFKSLSIVSHAALPMGLLSVGVGFELRSISSAKKEILVSSFAKLVLLPIIAYLLAKLMGANGLYLAVATLYAAMPTAPTYHILSRELGGDVNLMSSITTFEILLSMATLFVIIPMLGSM